MLITSVKLLYSGTDSITSLQDIIETKYSPILMLEGTSVYGQDGVKEYFQAARRKVSKSLHNQAGPTISMSINITNVDKELGGIFFWDLAHKAIRDRFRFDFDIASNIQATIAVDEFEAHHAIARRALDYLDKEPEVQTNAIGEYLVFWLPNHLESLVQLEKDNRESLKPAERDKIAASLYTLFKNDEVLRRHRAIFEKVYWLAKEMEDIQRWLTASTVVWKLDAEWWEAKAKRAKSPTKGYLRGFVNMVVEGFLRERSWDVVNASYWIEEFMCAVSFHWIALSDHIHSSPWPPAVIGKMRQNQTDHYPGREPPKR